MRPTRPGPRRLGGLALPIVAVAALASLGCSRSPEPESTFLLLTIDTLRADRLGTYGQPRGLTPALDRLAAESVLFSNCISVSSWTMPAMGTLATGLRPNEHGMVYWHLPLDGVAETLGEILSREGVATGFFGNPIPALEGIERGFESWETFDGDDAAAVDEAVRWLRETRKRGRRFLWVHLLSPHGPYDPLPGSVRPDSSLDPRTVLYDAEVLTVDHVARRLLRAVGPQAAIAVTADHGETLDERGAFEYDHGKFLYDELIRVPCLLRVPGGTGGVVREATMLADVAATIFDWFEVDPPDAEYGASLLPTARTGGGRHRETIFASVVGDEPPHQNDERWIVQNRDYKASFNVSEGTVRLYDRRTDPGETTDISGERPEVVERLRVRLNEWRKNAPTPRIPFGTRFSPAELDRLQSLGYLGGAP